jgi:hypothetical protein
MPQLAAIATVISAVGTGISYVAQSNAAQAQAQFAQMNASIQADNARQTAAREQQAIQFRQLMENSQEQARNTAAAGMMAQSEAATRSSQDAIRRQRQQFEAAVSASIARAGAGGVSAVTGSPLDALMDSAARQQEAEMAARDQDEYRRRAAGREALGVRTEGFAHGIQSRILGLESDAARMRGETGQVQARLGGMAAADQARGQQLGALGGFIGGIGGIARDAYSFWGRNRTVQYGSGGPSIAGMISRLSQHA